MSGTFVDTRLVIIGCGGVGSALIRHIIRLRESDKICHIPVRAVCDTNFLVKSKQTDQLDTSTLKKLLTTKKDSSGTLSSVSELTADPTQQGLEAMLQEMTTSPLRYIFADCTSSDVTGEYLARVVAAGGSVVLANKRPVTQDMALFKQLTVDPRRFRFESTCGAGMPLISNVTRLHRAGDPISKMAGALSGTLGFVMSGLEKGQSFSAVVRSAKEAGYTEPDPRDDLSGADVARKALILARVNGHSLELDNVYVESMYPASMAPENMDVEKFMTEGLPTLDADMQARVSDAAAKDQVLRYAALVEGGKCCVGLTAVEKDTPLGRLSGTDNLLEIQSECYSPNPLVLQGAGAGVDTTASGTLADIIELADCAPVPIR